MNATRRAASGGGWSATLRRDPKKATVLGILVLVLFITAGRAVLKQSPRQASATPAATAASQSSSRTAPGRATPATPRSDLSLAPVQAWIGQPAGSPSRNPFAVRQDRYRRADASRSTASSSPAPWLFDSLEKLASRAADDRKRQAILLENLQREAARLRLQSTVMGAQPKALIDGRLVREGDVVASGSGSSQAVFRVLRIEARRVILECQGIRLEITMQP